MHLRLGDVLIERGVLTSEQVAAALDEQKATGKPFGVICERLFGVPPEAIEDAWAAQYVTITRKIDPRTEHFDDRVHDLVSRRQAWQFRVLPIRYDGEELMMATTARHLRRALRFATKFIGVQVFFVMVDPDALGEVMCKRYPLAGMTPQSIDNDVMGRLLAHTCTPAADS